MHVDFEAGWLRPEPGETKYREGRMFPLLMAAHIHAAMRRDSHGMPSQPGRIRSDSSPVVSQIPR